MRSRKSIVGSQQSSAISGQQSAVSNQQSVVSGITAIWRYCFKPLTCFRLGTQHLALSTAFLLLAACTSDTNTLPPTLTPPAVIAKVLATVYISPTPGPDEQQATLNANPPTSTAFTQPTVAPTAYVGVFLGEAETSGDGGAVINPALLNAPTPFIPVTATVGSTCPAQADVLFGNRWSVDAATTAALGCPIEGVGSVEGSLQIFERGVMYFSPSGEIWALAPAAQRFWYAVSAPPVPPGEISVPEGLLAPSQGFGAVWRGLAGVQDALGFARSPEQGTKLSTQKFQNGLLLADGGSGQVFVLLSDGQALGPY